MFEDISGWRAGVKRFRTPGCCIAVPMSSIADVCRLLSRRQISHAVDGEVTHLESRSTIVPDGRSAGRGLKRAANPCPSIPLIGETTATDQRSLT
jgi:hypothetical protein